MSKILVIGDIMLDKYSYGSVKRLNPEWPNPLVNIDHEEYKLGGAANVAANISSLIGDVELIGIIWKDAHGEIFESLCKERNIVFYPIISWMPTITKQRFIENTYQQQLLRVDYEQKWIMTDQNTISVIDLLKKLHPEYIVFSDYNKWIISKNFVDWVKKYAQDNSVNILVDAKPNNLTYFAWVYLIKPNFKEFCQMIGNEELSNTDEAIKEYGVPFVNTYKINLVITRWNKWATLITQDGQFYSLPTQAQQVFDVTGAGDTFLAAIVYALSQWQSLKSAVEIGNKASWIVVGKQWTATVTPNELGL